MGRTLLIACQASVKQLETAVERAAALAHQYALRDNDAVHCACAEQLADPDVVAATGDRQLLAAWTRLGLATYDTNGTES